jgi:hypothetical protein
MVLSWFGQTQPHSVDTLIARKKYAKAIEIIRAAMKKRQGDRRLRIRLADVLLLNGQQTEAIRVLDNLADDVALAGNAAQAIALLKRILSIEPGRPEAEEKLAYYIRHRSRGDTDRWAASRPSDSEPEFGMEEFDDGPSELDGVDSSDRAVEDIDLAFDIGDQEARGVVPQDPALGALDEPSETAQKAEAQPQPVRKKVAGKKPTATKVVKQPAKRIPLQPLAPPPAPAAAARPDDAIRRELAALLDDVLIPVDEEPGAMGPEAAAGTPLFRDFSQQELIEVMRGLSLEHFAPGEIIVTEGEAGDSLYVLASGSVRAWVRGASGRNVQVRELSEGDFFGEISLLTGEARSATITASAPCELLRLDRATVDTITTDHPRVLKILKAFHKQRGENSIEAMIRQMGAG